MKLFLKILFSIFIIVITVEEVKSSIVVNILWQEAPDSQHLGGGLVAGNDRVNAFVSTASMAMPSAAVSGVSKATPIANVATKGGTSGLKFYGSLTEKFGAGYESIAVTQGKHLPVQLGQKLNTMSKGSWSKIYEAGILNGSRVETHYFFNATTGQYVNPFIKSSGWGRTFRSITGY